MTQQDVSTLNVAIVGAGWAGLAAAHTAAQAGHRVTVFEAAPHIGGRARRVDLTAPDGRKLHVDNGQHILIGAYAETLRLMQRAGIDPAAVLQRLPLTLVNAKGDGITLPDGAWAQRLPASLRVVLGIGRARGWSWRDKASLITASLRWQMQGFACADNATVADLCRGITPRVMAQFIEPLCVSALNLDAARASGRVFLRVMHDALLGDGFGDWQSNDLLLPRVDLSVLLPDALWRDVQTLGADLHLSAAVQSIAFDGKAWHVTWRKQDGEGNAFFDRVILAGSLPPMAALARGTALPAAIKWADQAERINHTALSTVYAFSDQAWRWPTPMLALDSNADAPAQFAFDRSALTGEAGLIALVISNSPPELSRADLQAAVIRQAQQQLGLALHNAVTVTDKRATFACTAGLTRPPLHIAPGLLACGDAIDGPYPATLEGAVRSGLAAAAAL